MDSVHATTDKPVKGILKKKGSEKRPSSGVRPSWDEMNILATYHPADKDYGHMKIDEPPTPFERSLASDEEEGISANELAKKLTEDGAAPKFLRTPPESSEEDDDEGENDQDKVHRRVFEDKRKAHYNEFIMMKRAREMMDEDEEEATKGARKAEVKAKVEDDGEEEGDDDAENHTA